MFSFPWQFPDKLPPNTHPKHSADSKAAAKTHKTRHPKLRKMSREIEAFSHLKHLPIQQDALHILKKIASLVKPIMRARGWRVGLLSEFYPDMSGLLGMNRNRGEEIQLRLRPSGKPHLFLGFEAIVDTMLHELTHIVHGPHDDKFNALWNQLRQELEGLMMKGFTGENFLTQGQRLGGRSVPYDEVLRLTRAEAEARSRETSGFGQRLGGAPLRPGQDIRSTIIESAERRRNMSEQGCANNRNEREIMALSQQSARNGFRTRAEEDSANEAAIAQALWELVQEDEQRKYGTSYIPPGARNPFGSEGGAFGRDRYGGYGTDFAGRNAARPPPIPTATRPRPPTRARSPGRRDYWECRLCTLHNPANASRCDVCGEKRYWNRIPRALDSNLG
jgi:hypothetical protein